MKKFCILRAPGTNCDLETKYSLEVFGHKAEIVHINEFLRSKLNQYAGLVIPGGFSYGDNVRSGAILGKIVKEKLGGELKKFAEEGRPILGICNGFQVLVEAGFFGEVALMKNSSNRYECRWVYLRNENGKCAFTKGASKVLRMPVAHGEGKLFASEKTLKELDVVLRYSLEDGRPAKGAYPANPNGSADDIAGICDSSGLVFGLMPHPERAFHRITYPDWTRHGLKGEGDGFLIFKNFVEQGV